MSRSTGIIGVRGDNRACPNEVLRRYVLQSPSQERITRGATVSRTPSLWVQEAIGEQAHTLRPSFSFCFVQILLFTLHARIDHRVTFSDELLAEVKLKPTRIANGANYKRTAEGLGHSASSLAYFAPNQSPINQVR